MSSRAIVVRRFVLAAITVLCAGMMVGSVSVLAAAPEAPGPVIAGQFGASRVTVHGLLSPKAAGHPGTYEFLYKASKTGCEEGEHAPSAPGLAMGGEGEEVSQELTGLSPETEYTVCLLERNLNEAKGEETVGPAMTFKTNGVLEAPTITAPISANITSSSVKLQGVLNPGRPGDPGSYEFVYRQSTSECERENPQTHQMEGERTTSPEKALGNEKEVVPSTGPVEVAGLLPNVDYTVCLLARNEAGETALSAPATFTTLSEKPSIDSETVSHVGANGVTVSAEINTGGIETEYSVQYGPTTVYGSETTPLNVSPSASTVTVPLAGLEPTTGYHFRVVLTNADGKISGNDTDFITYTLGTSGLPDGRIYEQVSKFTVPSAELYLPIESPDESIFTGDPFESSMDGDAVVFAGTPSTGGSGSSGNNLGNQYVALRLPEGGWEQINISPDSFTGGVGAFSSDISMGVLNVHTLPPFVTTKEPKLGTTTAEQADEYDSLYVRSFKEPVLHPLFSVLPRRLPNEFFAQGVGFSADLTHLLFYSNDALLKDGEPTQEELAGYVTKEIMEQGEITKLNAEEEAIRKELRSLPRGTQEEEEKYQEKEIELDSKGREVYTLEALYVSVDNRNELYVSDDGRLSLVNISREGKVVPGAAFGRSHAISGDGSRIFWTDLGSGVVYVREGGSRTVPVSLGAAEFETASSDGRYAFYVEAGKLWRFDVENETRVELAGSHGSVQGVVGANETGEDGAYVYFVSQEALEAPSNSAGAIPVSGEDNLYVLEPNTGASSGSRIVFVATLAGVPTAYMAPDGQALGFSSTLNLTGHPYPDEGSEEAYVYDANDSSLFCASCRAQASGGNLISGHRWVSESGDQVFFDSEAPLVSEDVNGTRDVYEWERNGSGTCKEADGCVYLLSNGIEGQATLVDASASGNDVFLATRQHLISEGQNEEMELYDARADGALPVAAPACTGTGCQGVPAPAPIFATPASVTFNGVGNFPVAAKPTVRSGGKSKPFTRAQKLAKALNACRKKHDGRARTVCETRARRSYRSKAISKRSAKREGK